MKKSVITFLSAILVFSLQASAQSTSDLGTWSSIQIVKSFGAPYAMARLEHRSFNNIHSTECWFAMVGGGYNFNSWLKGDLSYEYWSIPSVGNMIQHKAVLSFTETLKREGLAVAIREKYELAYNPATKSCSNTLRTRLRDGRLIQNPVRELERYRGVKIAYQNVLICGEISLGGGHSLDLFYMYHLFDMAGLTGACHLLGAGYSLVF